MRSDDSSKCINYVYDKIESRELHAMIQFVNYCCPSTFQILMLKKVQKSLILFLLFHIGLFES
jgi:hypothetical protein